MTTWRLALRIFAGALRGRVKRFVGRRGRRRDKEITSLGNHMLADIGLAQHDLPDKIAEIQRDIQQFRSHYFF
jgi:hypothetical protein